MKKTRLFLMLALSFACPAALAQAPLPKVTVAQTAAEKARTVWFRDAHFGLFIHWGLYSVPAGEWDGKTDYGEWIMMSTRMPAAQYAHFADGFHPTHFDPNAWVRAAKNAGMRYVVLTTKHHEGFALWDSKVNTFNVVRATPFQRDVVRELSVACRKAGLKFCVYYSDTDWRDPNFPAKYNPAGFHGDPSSAPDMDAYLASVKAQMRELLTNYGPLGIFWFDNGGGFAGYDIGTVMHGQELVDLVHRLQPGCLVNNRAGVPGDYITPEQEIPDKVLPAPWETCMTMNTHWGYNKHDQNWKSAPMLIDDLIDITSKGGNFLLNVGPTADGVFPPQSLERLSQIGQWMHVNGEAIYGAGPTPFGAELGAYSPTAKDKDGKPLFVARTEWRCTTRPGKLYIHLLKWPSGAFTLSGLRGKVTRATLLADPKHTSLPVSQEGDTVTVHLPHARAGPDCVRPVHGDQNMTSLQSRPPAENSHPAWFRDARFGLFLHWGIYAVPAGIYNGREVTSGTGEWIMNYARIPVAEYRALARQFNPTQYDPVQWMALAKEAGMSYVVITTKHHDGFALFDSKVSDWNVVQATPYGRDLIGPLVRAARAEGLKVGLYYSHDLDWVHPGGGGGMMKKLPDGTYVSAGGKWDTAQEGDFDEYLRTVSVPQVREILTAYQPDMIWWDYAQNITPERAQSFVELIQSHSPLISNNRLGGGFAGDLGTPEQHIPESTPSDTLWEACMTMNDTWGFMANDHNWKSADEIIRILVDVAGKGGNLLLNVGPTAEGTFPQPSVERLQAVGAWLEVYGEAIYGTQSGPYAASSFGTSTRQGNVVYLFLAPSESSAVILPSLPARILASSLIGGGQVDVDNTPGGLSIRILQPAPRTPVQVVKLTLSSDARGSQ